MTELGTLARWIMGLGALLLLVGGGLWLFSRLGIQRLPGDVVVRREGFTLYAPFGLMILLSLVLTLLANLFFRRG